MRGRKLGDEDLRLARALPAVRTEPPDLRDPRGPLTSSLLTGLQRSAGNVATAALVLQRAQATSNGGVFDDAAGYVPRNGTGAVGSRVGAGIRLDFTPNDLVEAPVNGIGLIQTVRGVTNRVPGKTTLRPTRDQDDTAVSSNVDDTGLVGPGGVAVDVPIHRPGRTDANRNPLYGVGFGASAPSPSLSGSTPSLGRTRLGSHVRNPLTGAFSPPVAARMEDWPSRVVSVRNQTFDMTFEVAALVTAGPLKDTYLGSVQWGWDSDTTGTVTLKPLTLLAAGAPTGAFMGAAGTWNAAEFHDAAGNAVPSVDLPTTMGRSDSIAAVNMTTASILGRLPVARREVAALPPGPGPERANATFEIRALETELAKRTLLVTVRCDSISDTGPAAVPSEDEVWLSLSGGGASMLSLTGTRTYRRADSHVYRFPLADYLPLNAPLHLTLNEHDRAGPGGREHDDTLVDFRWTSPFHPTVIGDPDRHYAVDLDYDK